MCLVHPSFGAKVKSSTIAATDHEGSVRELLNEFSGSENIAEFRQFDSFGNMNAFDANGQKSLSAIDSAFAFAGREWDDDASLYYNRARWFDPRVGRFLSEDPLGLNAGDTNLYRYASNDPVNFRDPSGYIVVGVITSLLINEGATYLDEQINGTPRSFGIGFNIGIGWGGDVDYSAELAINGTPTTVSLRQKQLYYAEGVDAEETAPVNSLLKKSHISGLPTVL